MVRKGFTLIELLVVISIIALLASVVIAALNSARDKGRLGAGRYFAAQVDHAVSDQAVGIWNFDECAGSVTADQSGNGNTISLGGGASLSATSPTGQGCSALFDGSTGYGNAGQVNAISGTNPFTLSLWVRPDRIAVSYDSPIAKSYWSGTNDVGWMLTAPSPGSNTLYFRGLSSTATCIGLTTPALAVGVWKQIVIASDGTTAKMYIDGAVISSTLVACGIDSAPAYNLYIGSRPGLAQPFKGAIDSLRIFSKALTASEIGKRYASEAPKFKLVDGVR